MIKSRQEYQPPHDCSHFEAMCLMAQNASNPEVRAAAQAEVDWMVEANNQSLQEDRQRGTCPISGIDAAFGRSEQSRALIEYLNEDIGSLFNEIHFELNDARTRGLVEHSVTTILEGARSRMQLHDFAVICDVSNNTASVIDRGELVLDLVLKIKPGSSFEYIQYIKSGLAAIDVDLTVNGNSTNSTNSTNRSNPVYGSISVSAGGSISSSAIGNMAGHLANSTTSYSFSPVGTITIMTPEQKQTAELPPISWECKDDSGNLIKMELRPEGTIGAHESLQLMMLLQSSTAFPLAFSPYLYVKKHNLERHFKFSA